MPLPKIQLRLKKLPPSKQVLLRDRQPQQFKRAKPGTARNDPEKSNGQEMIESDTLRLEALRLRTEEHLTYQQIADRLGCSLSRAHDYVNQMWSALIENIAEMQIQVKSDAMNEIEIMKQQLRPYIVDPNVTIIGADKEGNVVTLERWKAMNAAIDRMTRLVELQLKVAGVSSVTGKEGEGIGEQTLTDAVIRHIASFIIEKKVNAREVG